MTLVMVHENSRHVAAAADAGTDRAPHVQLLFEPHGNRHAETAQSARRESEIGLQKALELRQWLIVEGDVVELVRRESRLFEAISHRAGGKAWVVLLAG